MLLVYLIRACSCVKKAWLINISGFILVQVPFQDALDLVRTRKVFLKGGYAYIPHQEIVTIVLNDFRTRLSKALAVSHWFTGSLIILQYEHWKELGELAREEELWCIAFLFWIKIIIEAFLWGFFWAVL